MKKNNETSMVKSILEFANTIGRFRRNNTGVASYVGKNGKSRFVRYGERGSADIEGIINGYHVSIELKKKGEKQEKHQIEHEVEIVCAGGYYLLVDDLDVGICELKKIKEEAERDKSYRPINSKQRMDAREKLFAFVPKVHASRDR